MMNITTNIIYIYKANEKTERELEQRRYFFFTYLTQENYFLKISFYIERETLTDRETKREREREK
jgi:hypothetical protein